MTQVTIITIGDEILIGQIVDTNSAWLGKELNNLGFRVKNIISVADKQDEITLALNEALSDVEVVLVTGGLGPTKDDITKTVLSEMFNSPLMRDDRTFEKVKARIEAKGIAFNELNQQQAFVPECSEVIDNNNGTAPGMLFNRDGHILISMPGVPFEMKAMCNEFVFDRVVSEFNPTNNIHTTAITYGVPESILAERIAEWEDNLPLGFKLAYLPNPNHVRLRLSVYDVEDKVAVEKLISEEFNKLKDILDLNFIGFEGDSVESRVARLLKESGATLSLAESCTGGSIGQRITAMAGCSEYYKGGVIAYSDDIKERVLNVKRDTLDIYGAVSQQVVEDMARNVAELFCTNYSIAVSGIAGPMGGTEDKPVGTVWIAVHTPEGTYSMKKWFGNLRQQNIEYATNNALYMLADKISNK